MNPPKFPNATIEPINMARKGVEPFTETIVNDCAQGHTHTGIGHYRDKLDISSCEFVHDIATIALDSANNENRRTAETDKNR